MYIKSVSLKQMRNYSELTLPLSTGINILYGENAQGKTNFLESVYFCATGRSHRTHSDKDLIQFGKTDSQMQVIIQKDGRTERIDTHIKKDAGKGIAVNGISVKKLSELFGVLLTVIFSPEDLSLVKAGPSERRRFMDLELCQLYPVYYYELQQYYKVLKQRNALLKKIQYNKELKQTIFAWDEQLCEHGNRIMSYRTEFVQRLNKISAPIHNDISSGKEKMDIFYKRSVNNSDFMDKLIRGLERDIIIGSTSNGIHKDDLIFTIDNVDTRIFGSQGQQRTASLSIKLAEIMLIEQEKGEIPILLLDDVFSELDKERQKHLIGRISHIQTILTCTGIEDILNHFVSFPSVTCYNVSDGKINLK